MLNSVTLAPGAFLQTYARVVNQQGVNFLFGAWGDASISGNLAYLKMREGPRDARPGANLKLTQPFSEHVAFTVDAGYNETFVSSGGSGRIDLRFWNSPTSSSPKEYGSVTPSGSDGHSARPLRIRHAPRRQQPAGRGCRSEPVERHRRQRSHWMAAVRTIRSAWRSLISGPRSPAPRSRFPAPTAPGPPLPRLPARPTASAWSSGTRTTLRPPRPPRSRPHRRRRTGSPVHREPGSIQAGQNRL